QPLDLRIEAARFDRRGQRARLLLQELPRIAHERPGGAVEPCVRAPRPAAERVRRVVADPSRNLFLEIGLRVLEERGVLLRDVEAAGKLGARAAQVREPAAAKEPQEIE